MERTTRNLRKQKAGEEDMETMPDSDNRGTFSLTYLWLHIIVGATPVYVAEYLYDFRYNSFIEWLLFAWVMGVSIRIIFMKCGNCGSYLLMDKSDGKSGVPNVAYLFHFKRCRVCKTDRKISPF